MNTGAIHTSSRSNVHQHQQQQLHKPYPPSEDAAARAHWDSKVNKALNPPTPTSPHPRAPQPLNLGGMSNGASCTSTPFNQYAIGNATPGGIWLTPPATAQFKPYAYREAGPSALSTPLSSAFPSPNNSEPKASSYTSSLVDPTIDPAALAGVPSPYGPSFDCHTGIDPADLQINNNHVDSQYVNLERLSFSDYFSEEVWDDSDEAALRGSHMVVDGATSTLGSPISSELDGIFLGEEVVCGLFDTSTPVPAVRAKVEPLDPFEDPEDLISAVSIEVAGEEAAEPDMDLVDERSSHTEQGEPSEFTLQVPRVDVNPNVDSPTARSMDDEDGNDSVTPATSPRKVVKKRPSGSLDFSLPVFKVRKTKTSPKKRKPTRKRTPLPRAPPPTPNQSTTSASLETIPLIKSEAPSTPATQDFPTSPSPSDGLASPLTSPISDAESEYFPEPPYTRTRARGSRRPLARASSSPDLQPVSPSLATRTSPVHQPHARTGDRRMSQNRSAQKKYRDKNRRIADLRSDFNVDTAVIIEKVKRGVLTNAAAVARLTEKRDQFSRDLYNTCPMTWGRFTDDAKAGLDA